MGLARRDAVLYGDVHRHAVAVVGGDFHIVLAVAAPLVGITGHLQSLHRAVVDLPRVHNPKVAVPARAEVLGHHALLAEETEFLDAHAHLARRDVHGQEGDQQPEPGKANHNQKGKEFQDLHFTFSILAAGAAAAPLMARRAVVPSVV